MPGETPNVNPQWLVVYRTTYIAQRPTIYASVYDEEQIEQAVAQCEEDYGDRIKIAVMPANRLWPGV